MPRGLGMCPKILRPLGGGRKSLWFFPACYGDRHRFRTCWNRCFPLTCEYEIGRTFVRCTGNSSGTEVRTYGWLAIHFHFSVRCVVSFSHRIDGTAFVSGFLRFQFGRNLTDKCRSVFLAFDGQKALSRKLSNTVSSPSAGVTVCFCGFTG